MKVLSNPIFLQVTAILFCSSFAFLLGMILMRLLRKSIQEEGEICSQATGFEAMPLHVYNTVIRQLKQQQDELKAQSKADQQRSRTTERFAEAVFSNLRCGVLGIEKNGLIRSINPAARQVLGFASPVGMSLRDVFRSATVSVHDDGNVPEIVSDTFDSMLQSGSKRHDFEAEYQTPGGESRTLSIVVVPVLVSDGAATSVAILINDITELKQLRHELPAQVRAVEASVATAQAGV